MALCDMCHVLFVFKRLHNTVVCGTMAWYIIQLIFIFEVVLDFGVPTVK